MSTKPCPICKAELVEEDDVCNVNGNLIHFWFHHCIECDYQERPHLYQTEEQFDRSIKERNMLNLKNGNRKSHSGTEE